MKIIDISQEVFSCNVYLGDPYPVSERLVSMDKGELYNMSSLSMCVHNGTHIDAPFHFINDGKTVDQIPLDYFVGDCYVARHEGDVSRKDALRIMDEARALNVNDRILIAGNITVTEEAALVFVENKIKLIGNEGQTIGPIDSPMAVHNIILGENIIILEGIVLTNVKQGKYFLSAAPLNLAKLDGSPCRAYLIDGINNKERF